MKQIACGYWSQDVKVVLTKNNEGRVCSFVPKMTATTEVREPTRPVLSSLVKNLVKNSAEIK